MRNQSPKLFWYTTDLLETAANVGCGPSQTQLCLYALFPRCDRLLSSWGLGDEKDQSPKLLRNSTALLMMARFCLHALFPIWFKLVSTWWVETALSPKLLSRWQLT